MEQNTESQNRLTQVYLVFDKLHGEATVFSANGAGKSGRPHAKNKVRWRLYIFHKINSERIILLYVKFKIILLLEYSRGKTNLGDLSFSDDFLDTI